jgi:hypothetical protein
MARHQPRIRRRINSLYIRSLDRGPQRRYAVYPGPHHNPIFVTKVLEEAITYCQNHLPTRAPKNHSPRVRKSINRLQIRSLTRGQRRFAVFCPDTTAPIVTLDNLDAAIYYCLTYSIPAEKP